MDTWMHCGHSPALVSGAAMARLAARLAMLLLALGAVLLGDVMVLALPAAAQSSEGDERALAGFTADSFGDTEAAIAGVAASGHPQAARIIEALQDGRLLFSADDRKVYVREASGRHIDAATGEAVSG